MKAYQIKRRLGCRRSLPDHRDLCVTAQHLAVAPPPAFSTIGSQPAIYDQGQLGSCTANAITRVLQYLEMGKLNDPSRPQPSRLFQYYNSRALEGHTSQDSGATLRDAVRAVAKYGYIKEAMYPYLVKKFAQKPAIGLYKTAAKHELTAVEYRAVPQSIDSIKGLIAAGDLVVFGFPVYESFQHIGADGIMLVPTKNEALLGGHAVCAVGYDPSYVEVANSWGTDWGAKGYFKMPWSCILNPQLAFDLWTILDIPAPDANS